MTDPRNRELLSIAGLWLGVGAIYFVVSTVVESVLPLWVHELPPSGLSSMFLGALAAECRPEPLEQLRYITAISLAPLLFVALHAGVSRHMARVGALLPDRSVNLVVAAALFIQMFLCGTALLNWSTVEVDDYRCFDARDMATAGVAVVAALGLLVAAARARPRPLHPGRLPAAAAAAMSLWQLSSTLQTDSSVYRAPAVTAYHLPFTLGEFAAVANGRVPLVDFSAQYENLTALSLSPVFKVLGLGVGPFTSTMALLSLLSLLSVFAVIRACTPSGRDAIGPWLSLALFVPYLLVATRLERVTAAARASVFSYYAVGPLRYVGPFVLAAATAALVRDRSRGAHGAVALLAGCVALNNLDFGIPAFVASWVALTVGSESWPRRPLRSALRELAPLALGLAAVLAAYCLWARLATGSWPALSALTSYQRIFAVAGFMMLPMRPTGLHLVVFATFMAAIFRSHALRMGPGGGEPRARALSAMMLWSGVFGSGASMYFVGRSHPHVLPALFAAWGVSVMLLTLDCVEGWRSLGSGSRGRVALRVLPSLALLWVTVAFASSAAHPVNAAAEVSRLRTPDPRMSRFLGTLREFVRRSTRRGEPVLIAFPYGHRLAIELGLDNVFPFAHAGSLIVRPQLDAALAQVERHHVRNVFGLVYPELAAGLAARGFQRAGAAPLDAAGRTHAALLTGVPGAAFERWVRVP